MPRLATLALSAAFVVAACSGGSQPSQAQSCDGADTAALDTSGDQPATPLADAPFTVQDVASFAEPWAMTFLPGGTRALVTERAGKLKLWQADGAAQDVAGATAGADGGQGGFGDVCLAHQTGT